MNSMKNRYIHNSEFGYFYAYCSFNNNQNIKREISKFKKIVEVTSNLDARNNDIYNHKLFRKTLRVKNLLYDIVKKEPDFLIGFKKNYCYEFKNATYESDPNIIARNLARAFRDAFEVKKQRRDNIVSRKNNCKVKERDIVLNLNEQTIKILDTKRKKDKEFTYFISELKKLKYSNINRQINELNAILDIEINKNETKKAYEKRVNKIIKKANKNIDRIFKKGYNYPFRRMFIKALSSTIYLYDIKERKLSDLKNHLKEELHHELIDKYSNPIKKNTKKTNFGYEISPDTSTEMLIRVNEELIKEKKDLLDRYNKGENISFDRPFSNNIQSKKVDMINSFFDRRFDFELDAESSEKEFVEVILNLCEKADEITDDLFKKVLFDAHDSSNLIELQSYEKNEALRTLYSLYSPEEKLSKYEEARNRFEDVFNTLDVTKRDNIYKEVYEIKQKNHLPINELIPTYDTIINNLIIRETKFIDSHAVEEFRHKAMNYGKYLNYDLEIVARDILIDDLPSIYKKIKRNIMYTNFVDEVKPSEDREKKYREAKIVQNKTLAVAQEMIAKTILNKSYNREYGISYDNYQSMLNDIYSNVLHEERLIQEYHDYYDEEEMLEKNYQDRKQIWDENSLFVKALYIVISDREK